MTAYYNENNPKAAAWLRELIAKGMVAPGVVDERSIEDVRPGDVEGFTQCHFFAGIGVWSFALRCAGWSDSSPVWTGSCPCQPFSLAGSGNGFADERHLWPAFHWLISQCLPEHVLGEQVAGQNGLAWLDLVQSDMEGEGYSVGHVVAPACGFGAPHIRRRLYWVGHSASPTRGGELEQSLQPQIEAGGHGSAFCDDSGREETNGFWGCSDWIECGDRRWRPVEPGTFPLANGSPARVVRLLGYGNAIVAPQAEAFVEAYMDFLQGAK